MLNPAYSLNEYGEAVYRLALSCPVETVVAISIHAADGKTHFVLSVTDIVTGVSSSSRMSSEFLRDAPEPGLLVGKMFETCYETMDVAAQKIGEINRRAATKAAEND